MISTFDVLPGIHCENGGIGLLVGIDENGNGMLTSNEVQETTFVCNGIDGSHDATSGNSSSGLLSAVATLGHSDGCPAGGKVMMFGIDNGDSGGTASNGVLESGEIDEQTTYCSTQRLKSHRHCTRCLVFKSWWQRSANSCGIHCTSAQMMASMALSCGPTI